MSALVSDLFAFLVPFFGAPVFSFLDKNVPGRIFSDNSDHGEKSQVRGVTHCPTEFCWLSFLMNVISCSRSYKRKTWQQDIKVVFAFLSHCSFVSLLSCTTFNILWQIIFKFLYIQRLADFILFGLLALATQIPIQLSPFFEFDSSINSNPVVKRLKKNSQITLFFANLQSLCSNLFGFCILS